MTEKRLSVLVAIAAYENVYKKMPSVTEIASFLRLTYGAVHLQALRLQYIGYVEVFDGRPMTLSVTIRGRHWMRHSNPLSP